MNGTEGIRLCHQDEQVEQQQQESDDATARLAAAAAKAQEESSEAAREAGAAMEALKAAEAAIAARRKPQEEVDRCKAAAAARAFKANHFAGLGALGLLLGPLMYSICWEGVLFVLCFVCELHMDRHDLQRCAAGGCIGSAIGLAPKCGLGLHRLNFLGCVMCRHVQC